MDACQKIAICLVLLLSTGRLRAIDDSTTLNPLASIESLKQIWKGRSNVEIRSAATNGGASAQYVLAIQLIEEADLEWRKEGADWARLSADQGMAAAQALIGWAYQTGHGVSRDRLIALDWTRRSAEQGFAEGQYQLGYFLSRQSNTNGTRQADFKVVSEWYLKAAEQGHLNAQVALGDLYYNGKMGNDLRANCIAWYTRAAKQGHPDAKVRLADAIVNYPQAAKENSLDPVQLLRESAKAGNLEAQLQLALRYQHGDGVENSPVDAFLWMQAAAKHDARISSRAAEAKYRLAVMYETGTGVTKDQTNAYELYQEAAILDHTGSPDAQFRLGQMCEKGEGVPQDDLQAAIWYHSGATQLGGGEHKYEAVECLFRLYSRGRGLADGKSLAELGADHSVTNQLVSLRRLIVTPSAQFHVGEIYLGGKLTPRNEIEAAAWFILAADNGNPEATKTLAQIKTAMTAEDFIVATARSKVLSQPMRPRLKTR